MHIKKIVRFFFVGFIHALYPSKNYLNYFASYIFIFHLLVIYISISNQQYSETYICT